MIKCNCSRGWPVVNKKHSMCQACNYERMHGVSFDEAQRARSKAYLERSQQKQAEKRRNAERTNESPPKSTFKSKPMAVKSNKSKIKAISAKGKEQIKLDEQTYEQVWNKRKDDNCEECGTYIGSDLRNEVGKVFGKHRFSHILTKAAYPEHRNDPRNFNLLCMECHGKWETGDRDTRKGMVIWTKNFKLIQKLMNEGFAKKDIQQQPI